MAANYTVISLFLCSIFFDKLRPTSLRLSHRCVIVAWQQTGSRCDADVTVADHAAACRLRHALSVELLSPGRLSVVFRRRRPADHQRGRVLVVRVALAVQRGYQASIWWSRPRKLFSVLRRQLFRFGAYSSPAECCSQRTNSGQPSTRAN